jgi:hypothetical protein
MRIVMLYMTLVLLFKSKGRLCNYGNLPKSGDLIDTPEINFSMSKSDLILAPRALFDSITSLWKKCVSADTEAETQTRKNFKFGEDLVKFAFRPNNIIATLPNGIGK